MKPLNERNPNGQGNYKEIEHFSPSSKHKNPEKQEHSNAKENNPAALVHSS